MRRFTQEKKVLARVLAVSSVGVALLTGSGCDVKSFIDPSEMAGRQNSGTLLMPILKKLDTGVEEPNDEWVNATDPVPADVINSSSDYLIGAGDTLNLTISDIAGPGQETQRTVKVSNPGMINLPLIDEVKAAGLTEIELQRVIRDAYAKANIVNNANVTAQVVEGRGRTFSISGAVGGPGEYQIQKDDFRMMDALLLAGEPAVGADYAYIVRRERPGMKAGTPSTMPGGMPTETTPPTTAPGPDILAPRAQMGPGGPMAVWRIDQLKPRMLQVPADPNVRTVQPSALQPPAGMTTPNGQAPGTQAPAGEGRVVIIDGKEVLVGGAVPNTTANATTMGSGTGLSAPMTPAAPATSQPFEFQDLAPSSGERIIRVPIKALVEGDTRWNVVIKPNDYIRVVIPQSRQGFYYMGGHVGRPGAYQIQGSDLTLKQAIVSAGGLDQFAIPQRTDIIRRIGTDREVFARINVDAMFEGRQPDIFVKPNDVVMVGTNFFAPFIAAIRNGFRASYGFGFFYDKNLNEDDNEFDNN